MCIEFNTRRIEDIRPESKTYGQWIEVELKDDSGKALLVSVRLSRGSLALEDNTAVGYLVPHFLQ